MGDPKVVHKSGQTIGKSCHKRTNLTRLPLFCHKVLSFHLNQSALGMLYSPILSA